MTFEDRKKTNDKDSLGISLLNILDRFFPVVIVLAMIIILLVGYKLFLVPKLGDIEKAKEKYDETSNELAVQERKMSAINSLIAAYTSISVQDKNKINELLPNEVDFNAADLYGKIEALIRRNGLILNSINLNISPKKIESVKQTSERIEMMIGVSGLNYQGLKRLLGDMENNLQLIDVQSIDYYPSNNSARFVLSFYYYSGGK